MKWRKWISSLVVLALIVTLCPVSASSAGNTVNIPDPAFLAYLNSELDETRPSDTLITQEEMASFTSIDTHRSDEEIRSIEGISAAVNLKKLTISGDITGLEEIATLKNLTSLSVTDNKYVENLSFLGEKPDLISLTVGFAPNMTTLQGLTSQNCPSLATLNLSDNTSLVDISALANVAFPHLTKLDLGDSPAIPSISALRGYTSLTNLNLEKVEITAENRADYRSTVASLTSLTQLYMPYCEITDADAQVMFAPLSQLKTLVLNINELTNADFVDNMSASLTALGLYGNDIHNMEKLTKFQDLQILGFSGNGVTDFSFIAELPKLVRGSLRHEEGTASFPFVSQYYVGTSSDPIELGDGTLVVENPYVQPNGDPISFADALPAHVSGQSDDSGYTISYDEDTNQITLENVTGNVSFYVNYNLPLSNGDKVCKLFINVYAEHEHTWGKTTYTWAEDGSSCTASRVCEYDADHEETATATITKQQTTAPTCTQMGQTTYTATFNPDWAVAQTLTLTDVEPTGHTWAKTTYTWAEDGSSCTASRVCENDATHEETATAVITEEQTKAPTCTQAGQTTYTATFSPDWATTQTKTLANVNPIGHAWGETTYTWAEDGSSCTAFRVCENDGTHVQTTTAVITQEQTKAPTCTQMGQTTYTATFNPDWAVAQTLTLTDVEPTGHTWAKTTYTWAEDGSSCTASRVCENDATHEETATAVITQEQTKAPTCTQAGQTTYTATFSEDWAATQTLTLDNVAMLPHSYGETWKWDTTHHFHVCEGCGAKADAATHAFQWVTDSQAGKKYQECTICGYQLTPEPLPTPSVTPAPTPAPTAEPKPVPPTGDSHEILLWVALLVLCAGVLPIVYVQKRKMK